jgi:hypothetical protein
MAAGIDVLGPYGPAEFKETNLGPALNAGSTARVSGLLSHTMSEDIAAVGGTVVSCEPISVLGNVYLIVYTSS